MNPKTVSASRRLRRLVLTATVALTSAGAGAVTGVHPFGVNVRTQGPTTVFLTFQNLEAGEVPVEAFWCGELQGAATAGNPLLQAPIPVQSSPPCVPGSFYGRLPQALDRSRASRSGSLANLTDVMTIPASVARRALQDARAGLNSAFFYVRRFRGPSGDRYVVVTCRLAGGGARAALALTDVRLSFDGQRGAAVGAVVSPGTTAPRFSARLQYNGSGTLRGRWEVVQPGDPDPAEEDLLTAATLPVERRPLQRRWTLLERIEVFLPPTGEVTLPGPDPARLPTDAQGPYKILLRIEASDDREATSDTGEGRLALAGGVAGFALPALRYWVGDAGALQGRAADARAVALIAPPAGAVVRGAPPLFSWIDPGDLAHARLEVRFEGEEVLSALVAPGTGQYLAPPWFAEQQRGRALRWRVRGVDADGRAAAASEWRALVLQ